MWPRRLSVNFVARRSAEDRKVRLPSTPYCRRNLKVENTSSGQSRDFDVAQRAAYDWRIQLHEVIPIFVETSIHTVRAQQLN